MRKLFNRFVAKMNCTINGHGRPQIIERYETRQRAKNYKGWDLRNLTMIKPHTVEQVYCKWRCRTCGQVHVGVIVKDTAFL